MELAPATNAISSQSSAVLSRLSQLCLQFLRPKCGLPPQMLWTLLKLLAEDQGFVNGLRAKMNQMRQWFW